MARYCRICADAYAVLLPISEVKDLVQRISNVAHITVSKSDKLSTLICNPCLEIIGTVWEFYVHVRESYQTLLQSITPYQSYCRVCLCPYDNLKELLSHGNTCRRIYILYEVEIKRTETIPNLICKPCIDAISYSWKFFLNVQRKQVLLNDKFNIEYVKKNIHDIIEETDSDTSSAAASDDLLQELYIENIEGEVSENTYKQKERENKEENLCRAGRNNAKVVSTKGRKEQIGAPELDVPLKQHKMANSLLQLDGANNHNKETHKKLSPLPHTHNDTAAIHTERKSMKTDHSKINNAGNNSNPKFLSEKYSKICKVRIPKLLEAKKNLSKPKNCYCICCRKLWASEASRLQHEKSKFASCYSERQCSICFKIFSNSRSLSSHHILYDDLHNRSCSMCSKTFVDVHHLDIHKRAHELSFTRSCRICQQDFDTFGNLTQHEMSHRHPLVKNQSPFECLICGNCFENNSEAQEHVLSHRFGKHLTYEDFSNLMRDSIICHDNLIRDKKQ